jgi:hydrogenase maturation protease
LTTPKTLIIGIGNEILGDDGIGPRIVHDLSQIIHEKGFFFNTACAGGLEIIEHITGFDRVIFIDAIHTSDGTPGEVYYFVPSDFRDTSNLSNLHDISFHTALELAAKLNMNLTDDLHIIAIEIKEDTVFSDRLTESLNEKYPVILNEVISKVKLITGELL